MVEIEQQIRHYVSSLPAQEPIDVDEVFVASSGLEEPAGARRSFLVAAVLLVVVVIGAAVVVLRNDVVELPAPPVGPVGPTVVPESWDRIAQLDDAQAATMARSSRGTVLAGYGVWWSPDGSTWSRAEVEGFGAASTGFISDVVATPAGFLAVGVGGDRQVGIWSSTDGRSWERQATGGQSDPIGAIEAVTRRGDGYIAVGSTYAGSAGGSTAAATPVVPAVWASEDGMTWERMIDVPNDRGRLVGVISTADGTVALGTVEQRSYLWRLDGDQWREVGELEGQATALGAIGDRLIVSGTQSMANGEVPTIWSSEDGATWSIAHEERTATLGTFTELVADGSALLALGYTGSTELSVGGLSLISFDGLTWSSLPPLTSDEIICTTEPGGTTECPALSSHPVAAAIADGKLLLVTQEIVTAGPTDLDRTAVRQRLGIYAGSSGSEASTDADPLQMTLPAGWHQVTEGIYSEEGEGQLIDVVAVASLPIPTEASLRCALPVALMDQLGPDDAFVSVRSAPPGSSYVDPMPSPEAFIPTLPPESAYAACLDRDPSSIRFAAFGFTTGGRQWEVHIGMSSTASPATVQSLLTAVESLRIVG